MLLCVEDVMRNALFFQKRGKYLGFFNRYRTDKHRLTLFVASLYLLYDCTVFRVRVFIDDVIAVNSYHGLVRRHLDNVKTVNLAELVFLRQSRTGHTGEL